MNSFAFLLVCAQACLFHSALGVCSGAAPIGYGKSAPCELRAAVAGPYGSGPYYGTYKAGLTDYGYKGYSDYGYKGFSDYGYKGFSDYGCGQAYGGSGIGNVAVAGELPVGGSTALAGQVPIIGAVEYAGPVAAAGTVTIAGNCGCGAAPASYGYNHC